MKIHPVPVSSGTFTETQLSTLWANDIHPITVNDAYLDNFYRPERIQIWYGGSGGGKSDAKATELLLKCLLNKYCRVLFVRKFREQVRDSQFLLFKGLIARYGLQNAFHIKESEMDIVCPHNGNMLLSGGLDDVDKLKSIPDVTDIWIEEPIDKRGSISSTDFTELNRRLRCPKASNHIHMTFNPVTSESWIYEYFFTPNRYNTHKLKTTYLDNHFSPSDQVNEYEILKEVKPDEYDVYCLGNWGKLKRGLIFPEYEICETFPDNCKKSGYGLDWGFHPDPTAFIGCGILGDRLYLDELIYKTNLTSQTRADELKALGIAYSQKIVADRIKEPIEELKAKGYYNIEGAAKGPGSVKAGLDEMRFYKIVITRRSANLKKELDNYAWQIDKHTERPTGEPIDGFNHAIDAARYWVMAEAAKPKVRVHSTAR